MGVPHTTRRQRFALLTALTATIVLLGLVVYRHRASSALTPSAFVQTQGGLDSVQFSRDGRLLMTVDRDDRLVTFPRLQDRADRPPVAGRCREDLALGRQPAVPGGR